MGAKQNPLVLGCDEPSPAKDGALYGLLHIGTLPGVTCLGCKAASVQAEREELPLLCAGCSQLYFHLFYAMPGLGGADAFMGVCGQCLELLPSIPLSASGMSLIAPLC